ncbi:MAG: TetR/AcrR family transcriptional regulator [Acidimicrobiaceae bacterium]|nr:TetR/AcrR family transcriptional regulator [Acidimicrobiaceae bacterium]
MAPESSDGSTGRARDATERLLDAAVAAFAEHGFEAATVSDIARRAGLTTGAIYARWTGKRDLIVDAVRYIAPQCMQLSPANAEASARETLARVGADLVSTDNLVARGVMLEAFVSARRDDSFRAAVSHSTEEEAAKLGAIVSSGKAAGSVKPDLSTNAIVALYQALSLGMCLVISSQPEDSRVPAEEWEALISSLIEAMSPQSFPH